MERGKVNNFYLIIRGLRDTSKVYISECCNQDDDSNLDDVFWYKAVFIHYEHYYSTVDSCYVVNSIENKYYDIERIGNAY